MLAGLVLLEVLSIGLFAGLLIGKQASEVHARTQRRLASQASSLALQAREALLQARPGWIWLSARMMTEAPSVASVKVTDPFGNVLFVGAGDADATKLNAIEQEQIPLVRGDAPRIFLLGQAHLESMAAIHTDGVLRGFVWVEDDRSWDYEQLDTIFRGTVIFGLIWIGASILLVLLVARSISRPMAVLHRGTRALMNSPDSESSFPLPVTVQNEFGDLIRAFNRMVASIEEQRRGLNDTLSLLDSMLANAPIGLAFMDRRSRFVRVNHVFAEMTGVALSRHLGRTLPELLPEPVAQELEGAVQRVFADGEPVRDLELSGQMGAAGRPWTWLVSAYPVRTAAAQVRWVGVIVLDASERKRSEEALRRTEKLAATGRLAASIAHEINNPLEAITNVLFLLRNFCQLEDPALQYVVMAEHEVRRISEITQQTLRFYRQSTLPARAKMAELLDSVITLYHVRLSTLGIEVQREYDPEMDLYCFAGEVRQVLANLVGNAIDATAGGGRLMVRARRSRHWGEGGQEGVRFTVADTGVGIDPAVQGRIFEAFFTTKDVTGTGLGLWVSQEIILKHHGVVHMRSRTAASGGSTGTVFQVFFPDNQELTAPPLQPAAAQA
ncbi:MAG TPA: ATP-binding protein [Terracidiphilus sp.]|nr:ATP-binding protein [Terracidiphilus sp.]